MTREEILALDMADLEKRSIEIAEEVKTAEADALDALDAELNAIEERKAAIKAEAEEKRKAMAEVLKGEGKVIEEKQEERKTMDSREIRSSKEYIDAYAEYLKTGDATECRKILTENSEYGDGGEVAVPTFVEERINTAWNDNEILKRIRKTYFKGNLKVGYEYSAPDAVWHGEGENAISEEDLRLAVIEMIPKMAKKMIRVSDEVLAMRSEELISYLYDEIEYKLMDLVSKTLIEKVAAGSDPLVKNYMIEGDSVSTVAIIGAAGLLGGEAKNPVLIMTRETASQLKMAALEGKYAYDPFDGMEVLFVESMPEGVGAIIADLSGAQANFPEGEEVRFKFDDLTDAAADLVRIIGRVYVAVDITAPGKFVVIKTN